jgi:hypothetical protein
VYPGVVRGTVDFLVAVKIAAGFLKTLLGGVEFGPRLSLQRTVIYHEQRARLARTWSGSGGGAATRCQGDSFFRPGHEAGKKTREGRSASHEVEIISVDQDESAISAISFIVGSRSVQTTDLLCEGVERIKGDALGETNIPKARQSNRKHSTMGDRSPKSVQKQASQKQSKLNDSNSKKQALISSQQATKAKAAAAKKK